jgi:hypothetical protein
LATGVFSAKHMAFCAPQMAGVVGPAYSPGGRLLDHHHGPKVKKQNGKRQFSFD